VIFASTTVGKPQATIAASVDDVTNIATMETKIESRDSNRRNQTEILST
jgi:hypothetical protein